MSIKLIASDKKELVLPLKQVECFTTLFQECKDKAESESVQLQVSSAIFSLLLGFGNRSTDVTKLSDSLLIDLMEAAHKMGHDSAVVKLASQITVNLKKMTTSEEIKDSFGYYREYSALEREQTMKELLGFSPQVKVEPLFAKKVKE